MSSNVSRVDGQNSDRDSVAVSARTVLAGARCGVLIVAVGGAQVVRECSVGVIDDEGEAILSLPPDCVDWVAYRRPRWGSLVLAVNEHVGVGLTLCGRLHPSTPEADRGGARRSGTLRVQLRVEQAWVTRPRSDGFGLFAAAYAVPLMRYAAAEPDPFATHGSQVVAHLNSEHREQLRIWAAQVARCDIDQIAGASIGGLTHEGLWLWRVDVDGASAAQITFREPICAMSQFGEALREAMQAAVDTMSEPPEHA